MKLKITILAIAMTTSNAYAGAAGVRASYQVASEAILNSVAAHALISGAGGCSLGAFFGLGGSVIGTSESGTESFITGTGKVMGVVSAVAVPAMIHQMLEYNINNIAVPRKVTIAATASNIPIGFVTGMGATVLCGLAGYHLLEGVEDIIFDE